MENGNRNLTIKNVEFTKAGDGRVYFLHHGSETSRKCEQVIDFIDVNGNQIDYNCDLEIIKMEKTNLNTGNIKKVGSIFITLGGAILFYNVSRDCVAEKGGPCNTFEDIDNFSENLNKVQKVGYIFIMMGGLFLAIGL
jgi:hypothetical protein